MKNWMILAASMAVVACGQPAENSEETTDSTAVTEVAEVMEPGYYGDTISTDGAITTDEMVAQLEGKDSLTVKVTGEISGVCQKKGCWMDIPLANGETMKVKFKDYAFFVPMNSTGQTATLEGTVRKVEYSVAELRHLASDAGKTQEEIDAITEPEVKYSFMANGVAIQ